LRFYGRSFEPLHLFSLVIWYTTGFLTIFFILYGAFGLYKLRKKWLVDDYSALHYLLVYVVVEITSLATQLNDTIYSTDGAYRGLIAAKVYSFAFCIMLLAVVPGRIARIQALACKVPKLSLFSAQLYFFSIISFCMFTLAETLTCVIHKLHRFKLLNDHFIYLGQYYSF
jgi:hypothetical protein